MEENEEEVIGLGWVWILLTVNPLRMEKLGEGNGGFGSGDGGRGGGFGSNLCFLDLGFLGLGLGFLGLGLGLALGFWILGGVEETWEASESESDSMAAADLDPIRGRRWEKEESSLFFCCIEKLGYGFSRQIGA